MNWSVYTSENVLSSSASLPARAFHNTGNYMVLEINFWKPVISKRMTFRSKYSSAILGFPHALLPLLPASLTLLLEVFVYFFLLFKKKDVIYLFVERGRGGRKRERNMDIQEKYQSVAFRTSPTQGVCADLTRTSTFWFAGRHPAHWATPARAEVFIFLCTWGLPYKLDQFIKQFNSM